MRLKPGIFLILLLWAFPAQAQSPVITAENVEHLHSVATIDFTFVQQIGLTTGSGVFVMDEDASVVVSFASEGNAPPLSTAVVWDGNTGEFIKAIRLGSNFYDRYLTPDGQFLLVAAPTGVTAYALLDGRQKEVLTVENGPAVDVWLSESHGVCAEIVPDANSYVVCESWETSMLLFDENPDISRIGRVPAPFAVTTTEQGDVFLWNMETNEIMAEAVVSDVAVFGAVNTDATHLVWRNPMSTELHLLDFATGEDKQIAPLSGEFISYLLLSYDADVIFAIDPMDARSEVIAWKTEAGEQISLGKYRACNRQQPDFAQLSADGAALVIGCDSGLDIWRVE